MREREQEQERKERARKALRAKEWEETMLNRKARREDERER